MMSCLQRGRIGIILVNQVFLPWKYFLANPGNNNLFLVTCEVKKEAENYPQKKIDQTLPMYPNTKITTISQCFLVI